MRLFLISFLACFLLAQCTAEKAKPEFQTENVVVVVIDGARISETWNEPNRAYIPYQNAMLSEGTLLDNFWNDGPTWTMCGHKAIVTGKFSWIDNSGYQLPQEPTVFQQLRMQQEIPADKVWLVCSKGKIDALSNCEDPNWLNRFRPSSNCGVNGGGIQSGYRDDSTTFTVVMDVLNQHHPKMLLINFREPDFSAHEANYQNYTTGILSTDVYVKLIWDFIQSDPIYKNKTTLFVTNDHGRHLDSIADGFVSHGDYCEGCRHISLFALGPDFKKNVTIHKSYNQTDLTATIARLFNIVMPESEGEVIVELFK